MKLQRKVEMILNKVDSEIKIEKGLFVVCSL